MRLYIFLFLVFSLLSSVSAQQYHPFPTQQSTWRYRMIKNINLNANSVLEDILLILDGSDTMIAGKSYKKIFLRRHADTISFVSNPMNYYAAVANCVADQPDAFYAGIREVNKKVFIYDSHIDAVERLYYDFNLNLGDTINSAIPWLNKCVVFSIDSFKISGSYHNRISYRKPLSMPTVIEGFGPWPQWGPFLMLDTTQSSTFFLYCFTDQNGTYVPDSTECTYIFPYGTPTGITKVNESASFSVYPNPFSDQINIQTNEPCTVTIYNSLGQNVVASKINSVNGNIDTRALANGLYILIARDEEGNTINQQRVFKH